MKRLMPFLIIAVFGALLWFRLMHPTDHPPYYQIEWTEYIEQPDDITCGPTSATMLLRQYGKDVSVSEVEAHTKTKWFTYKGRDIGMTSPDYVSVAINHFGVRAKLMDLTIDELKHYVSHKRPVIVLVRSGQTTWHYVVVTGYTGIIEDNMILADPAWGGKRMVKLEHFKTAWCFTSDLDGVPTYSPCPLCGATGRWGSFDLGPLNICQWCNGTGKQPDYLGTLLRSADISPRTAIVPTEPLE